MRKKRSVTKTKPVFGGQWDRKSRDEGWALSFTQRLRALPQREERAPGMQPEKAEEEGESPAVLADWALSGGPSERLPHLCPDGM